MRLTNEYNMVKVKSKTQIPLDEETLMLIKKKNRLFRNLIETRYSQIRSI